MAKERILVALQGTDADDASLAAACALAQRYDADIRGLFVDPDPADYMVWTGPGAAGAAVVTTAMDAVKEESDKFAAEAERRFHAAIAKGMVDGALSTFRRIVDRPSDAAQQARLVRLLVAPAEAVAGKGPLADFVTSCLTEEGAPLYTPRRSTTVPTKIAVAWDGSKEAAHAVFSAEPLLNAAEEVRILTSTRNLDYHEREAAAPRRLANWLAGRGITATTVEVDEKGSSVGDCLIKAATGCDLLVAGAYGHSKITQFIFGGVTRTLMTADQGPNLLVAH